MRLRGLAHKLFAEQANLLAGGLGGEAAQQCHQRSGAYRA
jgi:hypothetical protein